MPNVSSRVAPTGMPPAHERASAIRAARYRVYQLWRSLAVSSLSDDDRAILDATLPPGGRTLFTTMSRNDQRHSLTVYRALLATGCDDGDLLAAALLHDSGKGGGRVPLWVRPPVVLLRAFAPGVLSYLARSPLPWWRHAFYSAVHHAEIGAKLAAMAGLSPQVVLLIRTHHDPRGPAAALHAVDDAV
ncbi:MAG TPA: hypothetical protein VF120_18615 [Ktedonobacterales bacterium]